MPLTILKSSFWKSSREIQDASHVVLGTYNLSNIWCTKAEGEALGRKLLFNYTGWDNRYSQMTDASGQVLARIEPVGWWGMRYKLTYNGKEYLWKMSGWGNTFMIYDPPDGEAGSETEIVRVHPGGYFKPGTVTVQKPMDNKDLIPLILYGFYQQYMIASQAAAASGGGS